MTPQQIADNREDQMISALKRWEAWKHEHELKLQTHPAQSGKTYGSVQGYRFATENGWHCAHWHAQLQSAAACIRRKVMRFFVHGA